MLFKHKRWSISFAGRALVPFLVAIALVGCNDLARLVKPIEPKRSVNQARSVPRTRQEKPPGKTDNGPPNEVPPAPTFDPPNKTVLFQPRFIWEGSEVSTQGTGFFAKAPNGKIAAVSSAHFLNKNGPPLLEAQWLDVRTREPVATFTLSWGTPGHAGTRFFVVDLRSDYLLMPAPESISADLALELDPRLKPERNERIWFPNKDTTAPLGYQVFAGSVVESDEKYSVVVLDNEITLHSQSGSPFISQATGKVIGTLSGADGASGRPRVQLTPAAAILAALTKDTDFPELRSVIGKQGRKPNR